MILFSSSFATYGVSISKHAFCTPSQLVAECLSEDVLDGDELNQTIQMDQEASAATRRRVCLRNWLENLFSPSLAHEVVINFLLGKP